eukprot:TRINITY_DN3269_c0_g4_i3.p4 TRINITY_DN3269_c0_g4~~TRINITY_DN3269_c0_g4_i3.p4  ORF type:complete len:394 (+),score=124.53 TRINITY_DN3269_c0_g4_i3:3068-4249(+)
MTLNGSSMEELMTLSVGQLKALLKSHNIRFDDCFEKRELAQRAFEHHLSHSSNSPSSSTSASASTASSSPSASYTTATTTTTTSTTYHPTTPPQPTTTSTASYDFESMSIKQLKEFLQARAVSHSDCFEKRDLILKAQQYQHLPAAQPQHNTTPQPPPSPHSCSSHHSHQHQEQSSHDPYSSYSSSSSSSSSSSYQPPMPSVQEMEKMAIDMFRNQMIPMMVQQLKNVTIPAFTNTEEWGEFGISEIEIAELKFPTDKVVIEGINVAEILSNFAASRTLHIKIVEIDLSTKQFGWHYKKSSFPKMKDKGTAIASLKGGTVAMDLEMQLSSLLEYPPVPRGRATRCAVTFGSLKMKTGNTKAKFLYNAALGFFSDAIKKRLCAILQEFILSFNI